MKVINGEIRHLKSPFTFTGFKIGEVLRFIFGWRPHNRHGEPVNQVMNSEIVYSPASIYVINQQPAHKTRFELKMQQWRRTL